MKVGSAWWAGPTFMPISGSLPGLREGSTDLTQSCRECGSS